MKAPLATFSLACLLAASAASAQDEPRRLNLPFLGTRGKPAPKAVTPAPQPPPQPAQAAAPAGPGVATSAKADPKVFPASTALPTPTPPDQIKPATISLPNDPIEPWLLTKEAGPFMVMARTFRGPEAERYALALAMELRKEHNLPAYVLRTKDFPNHSNIRGVPPTAPAYVNKANLTDPERVRSYDEAAVLVGNEKTLDDSEALLHRVKKIKPRCLGEMPSIFGWRNGLSTATRTTNPFVPAQNIFPGRGKRDHLIAQMNGGPRSVYNCPGRYTLQVAEFGGLATFNPSQQKNASFFSADRLKKSPLATAADNAERLADSLARDPDVMRTGSQPYVYHDRTTSKVMLGAFNDPGDPAAAKLRETMIRSAIPIAERVKMGVILAPGATLTDLEDPNRPIKAVAAK